jgi:hypothetical protein
MGHGVEVIQVWLDLGRLRGRWILASNATGRQAAEQLAPTLDKRGMLEPAQGLALLIRSRFPEAHNVAGIQVPVVCRDAVVPGIRIGLIAQLVLLALPARWFRTPANVSVQVGSGSLSYAQRIAPYNCRSERAFRSSLSRRTIPMVLRISASFRATPIVDAIKMSWALSSR